MQEDAGNTAEIRQRHDPLEWRVKGLHKVHSCLCLN